MRRLMALARFFETAFSQLKLRIRLGTFFDKRALLLFQGSFFLRENFDSTFSFEQRIDFCARVAAKENSFSRNKLAIQRRNLKLRSAFFERERGIEIANDHDILEKTPNDRFERVRRVNF